MNTTVLENIQAEFDTAGPSEVATHAPAGVEEPLYPRGVRVEEVEDEGDPPYAGQYAQYYREPFTAKRAGSISGRGVTTFEKWAEKEGREGTEPWVPFADRDEWDFAAWLTRNLPQGKATELLQLPFVR